MQLGSKTGDLVSQNTQLIEDIHFSEAEVKTKTARPSYVILGLNLGQEDVIISK